MYGALRINEEVSDAIGSKDILDQGCDFCAHVGCSRQLILLFLHLIVLAWIVGGQADLPLENRQSTVLLVTSYQQIASKGYNCCDYLQ